MVRLALHQMVPGSLRLFISLFVAVALAVFVLLTAAVGGLRLLDDLRRYVAGEAVWSEARNSAVLALHRYAVTGDDAYFAEYERLTEAQLANAVAGGGRRLFGDRNPPIDDSRAGWLFRTLSSTEIFAPAIEARRQADIEVVQLDQAARDLHRFMASREGPAPLPDPHLARINAIDAELSALGQAFVQDLRGKADGITWLLCLGIVALGATLLLATLAVIVYVARGVDRANRMIRQREERFRDVAEMSADWIWETDRDDRLIFLSDRVAEVTGTPKEDLLGCRPWEVEGRSASQVWEALRAKFGNGERIDNLEFGFTGRNGKLKTIRISGKPIFEDGAFVGYRGTGTDISVEVAAQYEAERRRELLETTFENLGQGIIIVDKERKVAMFNQRLLELLDLPEGCVAVGDDFRKFLRYHAERGEYGPGDIEQVVEGKLPLLDSPGPRVSERKLPDGTIVQVRGHPLPSGGYVITYRDVTIKREAQAALERSERSLRGVIDSSVDAYVSIDQAERVIDWNPAAARIFGWSRGEAIGRDLKDLILPDRFRADHRHALLRYLASGTGRTVGQRRELTARRRDGSEFPIELAVSAQSSGEAMSFNAFIRDISGRKEYERQLMEAKEFAEAASRIKSEFLAHMSHELRTPLNAIIGFADVMVHQMMGPISSRYADYAADIRKSGDHLLELINDILDLSSVEAGKVTIEASPVDIREAVAGCLHLLAHTAEAKDIRLVNEVPEDAPWLEVDARRLRQILNNLIGNSLKFSPPGSSVTVRLERADDGVSLEVADQGIGLEPHELERVFEPFVQLRPGTDRAHMGTGLGLTLVKNLVEAHDGTITLDSRPGQGTTAKIRFPHFRVLPLSRHDPRGMAAPNLPG